MNSKHASKHKRHRSGIKGFIMVLTSWMSRSCYLVVTFFFNVCLFEPPSLSKVWVIKGCEGNPIDLVRTKIGQLTLLSRSIISGNKLLGPVLLVSPVPRTSGFLRGFSSISSSERLEPNISWEVSSDGNTEVGLTINYRVRESGNTKEGNKIQSDLDQQGAGGA